MPLKKIYKDNRKIYYKSKDAIKLKLINCKIQDKIKKREFNIDENYVKELLEKQNNICDNCKIEVKLEWIEPYDPLQLSINRIDNKKGHIKGNCNILCWGCNDKLGKEDNFNRGSIYRKRDKPKNEKEYFRWIYQYIKDGKQTSKSFSINKYGDEGAKQMCIDLQNSIFP